MQSITQYSQFCPIVLTMFKSGPKTYKCTSLWKNLPLQRKWYFKELNGKRIFKCHEIECKLRWWLFLGPNCQPCKTKKVPTRRYGVERAADNESFAWVCWFDSTIRMWPGSWVHPFCVYSHYLINSPFISSASCPCHSCLFFQKPVFKAYSAFFFFFWKFTQFHSYSNQLFLCCISLHTPDIILPTAELLKSLCLLGVRYSDRPRERYTASKHLKLSREE